MNDDQLILYYYDDGLSDTEREEIAAALERDSALGSRYALLKDRLDGLQAEHPPAPRHVTARFHDTIERAARMSRAKEAPPRSLFHLPSFVWGTVVAAALVAGIAIGVSLPDRNIVQPPQIVSVPNSSSATAFTRGLQVHLRESQADIASLPFDDEAERTLLVLQMIQQNRIYERAAEQNGADDLARVLRAFEPILARLADDDISAEDAEALRTKLAFELNVMLTKMTRGESDKQQSI